MIQKYENGNSKITVQGTPCDQFVILRRCAHEGLMSIHWFSWLRYSTIFSRSSHQPHTTQKDNTHLFIVCSLENQPYKNNILYSPLTQVTSTLLLQKLHCQWYKKKRASLLSHKTARNSTFNFKLQRIPDNYVASAIKDYILATFKGFVHSISLAEEPGRRQKVFPLFFLHFPAQRNVDCQKFLLRITRRCVGCARRGQLTDIRRSFLRPFSCKASSSRPGGRLQNRIRATSP